VHSPQALPRPICLHLLLPLLLFPTHPVAKPKSSKRTRRQDPFRFYSGGSLWVGRRAKGRALKEGHVSSSLSQGQGKGRKAQVLKALVEMSVRTKRGLARRSGPLLQLMR